MDQTKGSVRSDRTIALLHVRFSLFTFVHRISKWTFRFWFLLSRYFLHLRYIIKHIKRNMPGKLSRKKGKQIRGKKTHTCIHTQKGYKRENENVTSNLKPKPYACTETESKQFQSSHRYQQKLRVKEVPSQTHTHIKAQLKQNNTSNHAHTYKYFNETGTTEAFSDK